MASAAARSKAVGLLLLVHHHYVFFLCLVLVMFYAVHSVLFTLCNHLAVCVSVMLLLF